MEKIYMPIYRTLQKIAAVAGFDLKRVKKTSAGGNYEPILVTATYAPWCGDQEFKNVYATIKDHTLVDKYRCYELWQLVSEVAKLPGALIEVGVWKGGSGALIAKAAELAGVKDTVYLCDTFTGVVKAGTNDSSYKGGEHADTSEQTVRELIRGMGLNNVKILTGIFPEETEAMVKDKQFRFCHIDVDVYQSAKDVVAWLWPRLAKGGIVVFDDYGFAGCDGINRLVNEERNKTDRIVIHNLNGHAIMIKILE